MRRTAMVPAAPAASTTTRLQAPAAAPRRAVLARAPAPPPRPGRRACAAWRRLRSRGARLAAPVSVADAELSALRVRFLEGKRGSTWKLQVDVARKCDSTWRPELDDTLLQVLRQLEALGALPDGVAARSSEPWAAAEHALSLAKAGLAASGAPPQRAASHDCAPGYGNACCKQARAQRRARRASFESRSWPHCLRRWHRAFAAENAFRRRPKALFARHNWTSPPAWPHWPCRCASRHTHL
jgi:hypothetical protein